MVAALLFNKYRFIGLLSVSKQWGLNNDTAESIKTFSLNLPFTNANYAVVLSYYADTPSGNYYSIAAKTQISAKTVSSFKAWVKTRTYWLASGF